MSETSAPPQKVQPGMPARRWCFGAFDCHGAGLIFLFAVEALVFYSQLASRILPYHPVNHDQVGYMVETYRLLEHFQLRGWSALLAPILEPGSATGATFALQGALLAVVGGANRTAMLTLNLIYFVALQIVLFNTVRICLRSIDLAWIAIGLLISLGTLFNLPGGIFDYRIDFAALCLYGIWVCLVIRSDRFDKPRIAAFIVFVTIWLVAMRFFTILYLGLVFSGLLIALLISIRRAASPVARDAARRRARNLFISGALVAMIVFPLLFVVRQQLYVYYGIGHLLGAEKYIRAAEAGIQSLYDNMMYYPNNLLFQHMGQPALWLIAAVVVASIVFGVLSGQKLLVVRLGSVRHHGFDILALVLATLVPLTLLTLNLAKSPVVAGIVDVPIILLVVTLVAMFWPREDNTYFKIYSAGFGWPAMSAIKAGARGMLNACGRRVFYVVVVVCGLAGFLRNAADEPRIPSRLDRERMVALNEFIVRHALDRNLSAPKVSVDRVVDYIFPGTIELYGFERFRRMLDVAPRFGHGEFGIFATAGDVAMKLVQDSDIVVLTDPLIDRGHPYPMNTKIREYWDELWRWSNDNLDLVYTTNILGIPYRVFARPKVRIRGADPDTSHYGLTQRSLKDPGLDFRKDAEIQ